MCNIFNVLEEGIACLETPIGIAGSLITIFDHFRNQNQNHIQETLSIIREKSSAAYEQYCEYREYRSDELGIPLKEDILGYWESCLQRNVLPTANDMVVSQIASENEAKIIMAYLMEQWMTIPDFLVWMHGVLSQNHLETISEKLTALPQLFEAASQIKAWLNTQQIYDMATLITPGYVNDAKFSCNDLFIKNFFIVNNDFHTMIKVISAEEDVPHKEAAQAVEELVQNGFPIIIAGNGGQGKTSLMMRTAVKWASLGHLAVWLALSNKEIITEQAAEQFFNCLIKLLPEGQSILLCIDNPFEGRISFSSLRARWPYNAKIHLLMAERENRLTQLVDPDQDLLLHWFDDARLVVLQGINETRKYYLKDYKTDYFKESQERRKIILKKSTSYLVKEGAISEEEQLSVINDTMGRYGKPYVSLVELIYRTLFELKKITSKPESIKLDWEEWGELIRREFGDVDSDLQLYGLIAALKVFNTPLTLSLFCKYFDLNERKLKNRLCELRVPGHVEPVIYQEGHKTLHPKHDVIAELFFLFNSSKVTINSLITDLIETMDENEVEVFLTNIINKREVQKGYKRPIGVISYWDYMQTIYSRIQKGSLKLSRVGNVYLCLGVLWAKSQRKPGNEMEIGSILEHIAPEIENDLLMAKLYTEWGIWAVGEKNSILAEEKFLAVIEYNPKQLPARTELGRLLSRQKGREAEAEKILREIITIDSRNIQSRTELGRLLSRQKGREAEAEKILREAMKIDPKHIQSRTELGRLLSGQKGREAEAEKILREIITIVPRDLQSRTELGRLLSRQKGRELEAEKFLQEAITIDSKNLHPRTVLAKLYERMNRLSEARQLYQELCDIAPDDRFGKEGLSRLKQ